MASLVPPKRQAGPIGSLWRLRGYMRPYTRQLIAMLAAAFAGVGASIVVPLVTRQVVDGPIAHHQHARVLPLALLALALGIAEAGLVFTRRWIQNTATLGIEKAIRRDIYEHLQALPPSFHDDWQTGQLLSRATTDLSQIRRFIGFGVVFLLVNIATFATIVTILVILDPLLGAVVAVCLLPLGAVCWQFERRFRVVSRRVQDQTGDLATSAEEAATGIRVIRAFGRRDLVTSEYVKRAREIRSTQLEKISLRSSFVAALDIIPNLTLVVVLLIGALAVGQHSLSLGSLVAFITLVLQLVWPVEALGFILAAGQEAGTAAQRLFEVLDVDSDITDRPGAREITTSTGHLRFDEVGFSYPGAESPILHEVSFEVNPGETLAIVGLTGSGKTTLTQLVPRLADVTAGSITLDGTNIRDFTLRSLRTLVATAFEEPTLFSASVRENVTLGWPDATDEEIAAALSLAQADFVYDLPWGLDTRVGEQGMSLSGGQRQRLALARAVVGKPRVLVLDDPLSALDVETEALVEAALRRVLASTTALLVVHRPSTVALADRVALLHDGTVRAVGTHSELMATVPEYADILGSDELVGS